MEDYNELKEKFNFTGITVKGDSISFSFLNKETAALHVPMAYLEEAQTEQVMEVVDKIGFMMLHFLNYVGRSYYTNIGYDYQEQCAEPVIVAASDKADFREYYKSEGRIMSLASSIKLTRLSVNDIEQKIKISADYFRSLSYDGFMPDEKPTKINIPSIWMDLDYEDSKQKDRFFLFAPELKNCFNAIKEIAFDVLQVEATILGKMAEQNELRQKFRAQDKKKEDDLDGVNEPKQSTDNLPI